MPSKVKVSLTLEAELVATIDRDARRTGYTRSGLIEVWLKSGAARAAERSIDEATAAYYASIRGPDEEGEAIALAASSAARHVEYDERPRRRRGKRTRA
jgi:metal-responsive CopG/Arc/MetJ family transcriptional regulator